MAEKRTVISKLTMHYGVIHHAQKLGKISVFNTPELDERFLTLRSEDLLGSNLFDICDSSFPILAQEEISYLGQPLIAVFGPDYESVLKICQNIKYTTIPITKDNYLFDEVPIPPETLEWGNLSEILEKPDLKQVTSEYNFQARKSFRKEILTCTAWQDASMIHVELPCQWPELVRQAVSKATAFSPSSIVIHQLEYYAPLDEYLFIPSVVAALAATACLKLSSPIQLREPISAYSPSSTIKRISYCNQEGRPLAEKVEMTINQGSFPILEKEAMIHAITGLLPNYPVNAFFAQVNIAPSKDRPASFFGSLSYSDSLCASQLHSIKLAKAFKKDTLSWHNAFKDEKRHFTDYLPSIEVKELIGQATSLAKKASFLRNWSSYDIQNGDFSILPFSRGVAIAMAPGISGFSTSFCKNQNYQIKLTLTEKGNLTITTSMYTKGIIGEVWALMIKKELNLLEDASIIFNDRDATQVDSGPDTLGLTLGQIPQQIIEGCQNLLLSKEKRPTSLMINTQDIFFPCEFENQGTASIIIETRISAISYLPIVTKVYAYFIFGKILDQEVLRSQLKNVISETLSTSGAIFSTDPDNPYTVDLTIKNNGSDYVYTLDSTLRGLTQAAFLASISQALGKEVVQLPITTEMLFNLKNKTEEKK